MMAWRLFLALDSKYAVSQGLEMSIQINAKKRGVRIFALRRTVQGYRARIPSPVTTMVPTLEPHVNGRRDRLRP